jgi:hypothetical protein
LLLLPFRLPIRRTTRNAIKNVAKIVLINAKKPAKAVNAVKKNAAKNAMTRKAAARKKAKLNTSDAFHTSLRQMAERFFL